MGGEGDQVPTVSKGKGEGIWVLYCRIGTDREEDKKMDQAPNGKCRKNGLQA